MNAIFTQDSNRANRGLQLKDISDWLKIIVIIVGAIVGYIKLSDKVDAHTSQLEQVKFEISRLREESQSRADNENKTIGRIEMYLSSKDKDYWKTAAPQTK